MSATPSNGPTAEATGPQHASGQAPGYLARVFAEADDDARYARVRRRRNRLMLVGVQVGLVATSLSLLAVGRTGWATLAFLPFFPLMSLINVGIHGVLDVPASQLDEVMLGLRTEAKARAHTVLLALLGVVVVVLPYVLGSSVGHDGAQTTYVLAPVAVGLGLLFVGMLLPTWIVAWRLPSGVDDEPGDGV